MKAVTNEQMRSIETAAVGAGVSQDQLMENAGRAVADAISRRTNPIFGRRIVVLVGPGNNGSDGLVAARRLSQGGATVRCFLLTKRPSDDPKRKLAEQLGVTVLPVEGHIDEFELALGSADLVVDAVLGTGRARPIAPDLARTIALIRESGAPIYSVDIPTGLDANSGQFDPAGLPAKVTYMLGLPKLGALVRAGDGNVGEFEVLDIGLPPGLADDIDAELIDAPLARTLFRTRPLDGNKGTFGKALIFAGSPKYTGAATLATAAACRSGAGLITLAARQSVHRLVANGTLDAICLPLPEDSQTRVEPIESARQLLAESLSASALLVGPGLGRETQTDSLVRSFLFARHTEQPAVLDADCLNVLSETANWWERVQGPKILTPHPGEMGRLLGTNARKVQEDRIAAATGAARQFGATVVLKGAATLIAGPDGSLRVSPWVNPGLAKGGTGDVLAGLMVGLLAQAPDRPYDAATLAVYIHGLAGKIASEQFGLVSMTASDVVDALPDAFLRLTDSGTALQ